MPLSPGHRLGPYEIVAALGAGGMGEVYRARDSKLKREIALKVLPADVASDRDRLARFQREAEVLASLNHPNIAHIHGLEENALVMELVEGEDLAQRIARGAIPLDEALPIAKQIADALEAAHLAGVIHRDLKPANIKVREDGTVKVLDFGLAKAMEPAPGSGSLQPAGVIDQSPTITSPAMTRAGIILGTAAYMSPEQAKGKPVDERADIWAFGCVLYEMLAGKKAFDGEDVTDTLTAVMRDTPDWQALPTNTPTAVRTALRRCIEKDGRKRAPHIAVARLAIEDAIAAHGEAATPERQSARTVRPLPFWFALASVAVVSAGLAGSATYWMAQRARPEPRAPYRSTLLISENLNAAAPSMRFALSPDGRRLAYAAAGSSDTRLRLWIRSLDTLTAQPVAGSEGAVSPFWSPDSRHVAFFADGALKRVDVTGGPVITVSSEMASGASSMPGSWSQDDVIIVNNGQALARVSASGGPLEPITTPDVSAKDMSHDFPHFLPDGKHFVFASYKGLGAVGTYVGSLDGTPPVRLMDDGSNVQYASGFLLFARGGALMAQPFDLSKQQLSGHATIIIESILQTLTRNRSGAAFSVSRTGALVYQTALGVVGSRLVWSTRTGQQTVIVDEPIVYRDLSLSPDGKQAAISPLDERGRSDIWLLNLSRGVRTRFTFSDGGHTAIWSPDGRAIAFNASARGGGSLGLFRKLVDGSGDEEPLPADGQPLIPQSWHPDGRVLLTGSLTGNDLWILPLDGSGKPSPFANTRFSERWGQFSPDGRWIAYTSDETGNREVYIARYGGGGRRRVSAAGGSYPRWSRDGRELYFYSPDNKINAARIVASPDTIDVSSVTPLFDARTPEGFGRYFYDVAPDGRFLLATPISATPTLMVTLLVDWPALVH